MSETREHTEIEEPLDSYQEFPGPVLLLAGPGTGKTYQLAKRVSFIATELEADPDGVAVITFTNEAARNMRERLREDDIELPPGWTPGIISTMHSLGNAIIGSAPDQCDLPEDYRLLTDDYLRTVLLQDAASIAVGDRDRWKRTSRCRIEGNCDEDGDREKCQVCASYRSLLRKCHAVDYDDQILLACRLLDDNPDVAASWRRRTKHLLVDEYQDINEAQFQLIRHLSEGQTEGLFVVGDDDQSIYSFRGGTPAYIQDFTDDFEGDMRIGRLSKSWRCPEHILCGAKAVIAKFYPDSEAKPDPTFTDKLRGMEEIQFIDYPSEQWEANGIAKMAAELVDDHKVIVIVPNSRYFPLIRDALRKKGVPYRYKARPSESGIVRFTTLADWCDAPHDSLKLRHVLDLVIQNHDGLVGDYKGAGSGIVDKRRAASDLVSTLWSGVDGDTTLLGALSQAADGSSFLARLKLECLDQTLSLLDKHGGKRKHLPEFLERCGLLVAPGRSASGVVNEVREWREEIFGSGASSSTLPVEVYNLPSSKGLEGDVVFVVGVTEGILPKPDRDMEEQSRLMYVAMSRAKRKLYLLNCRKRSGNVTLGRDSFNLQRSRFVEAIPSEHLDARYVAARKKARKRKR